MKILILMIVAYIIVSCTPNYRELVINDASKDTTFYLKASDSLPDVLIINFEGQIDDTCKVFGGLPITTKDFNKDIFLDAYGVIQPFTYKAYKVKKGKIKIRYRY